MSHRINDGLTNQQRYAKRYPERRRASVARCRQRPHAKEAHRKRQLRYAAEHREQERLRVAQWRAKNPMRDRDMHREYYKKNRDDIRAKNKAFRLANPERYREYSQDYQHRRRSRIGEGKLPYGFRKKLLAAQNGRCNACDAILEIVGKHLDHIVALSKGGAHSTGNVQYLCGTCNRRKAARDFNEFLELLEKERCSK